MNDQGEAEALFRQAMEGLRLARGRQAALEACEILERAAQAGHGRAMVQLGQCYQQGRPLGFDPDRAVELYRGSHAAGVAAGTYRLGEAAAIGLGGERDPETARSLIGEAAGAGHPVAAAQFAFCLDHGIGGPADAAAATAWYLRAAVEGLPRAAHALALRYTDGYTLPEDPEKALWWAQRAAAADYPDAAELAAELGRGLDPERRARAVTRKEPPADRPTPVDARGDELDEEVLSEAPRIRLLHGLAPRDLCAHVRQLAGPFLSPSRTVRKSGELARDPVRTSDDMGFYPANKDLAIAWFEERLAAVTGVPLEQGEPLVALRYRSGGDQYRPHHDYFDPAKGHDAALENGGQRILTILTYLNDVEAGGSTDFPDVDLSIAPRRGTGVMFHNLTPEGELDPRTRHAGRPVETGEKWLCTRWFRERPYVARIGDRPA